MKHVLALLVLGAVLSGCTTPEEEQPDLFGSCPQWIAGPSDVEQTVQSNETTQVTVEAVENGTVPLVHQGYPLDMYLLSLRSDAPVEVRAFANDRRVEFHVVRGDQVQTPPFLAVEGQREAQVFLTPVEHGAPAAPASLRLDVQGTAEVVLHATPFYRVCGVLLEA